MQLKPLSMRVANKAFVGRPANGAQANGLRDLVSHLSDAAARDDDGDAHLGRFDDHFAGEAACGVEDEWLRLTGRERGALTPALSQGERE